MKTYAFHIQKGGVGKTTISGNIAAYLSKKGRTILIDSDPQANSTSWFGGDEIHYELSDFLSESVALENTLIEISSNFFLLPSSTNGDLKNFAETKLFTKPFIFSDLNNQLEKLGFDYAIYDLGPGMSQLEKSVIMSIDEVITPVNPEYFSIDGLATFSDSLAEINKNYRVSVLHNKIICNMLNLSINTHKNAYKVLQDKLATSYQLFTIGQDAKLKEAQTAHQSIFDYSDDARSLDTLTKIGEALCQ